MDRVFVVMHLFRGGSVTGFVQGDQSEVKYWLTTGDFDFVELTSCSEWYANGDMRPIGVCQVAPGDFSMWGTSPDGNPADVCRLAIMWAAHHPVYAY
jgi:hypothetical protein